MFPMTSLWRSDLGWLAHVVGIVGFALIILSMLYSLRKRRWLLRSGGMARWLTLHHWAGFVGGLMALVHTLGNFRGLGLPLALVLVLVLASSGVYLVERRLRRPFTDATAEVGRLRRERDRLDNAYREMYARGQAGTQEGRRVYDDLMAAVKAWKEAEAVREGLRGSTVSLAWWRHVHNYGTMMMVGLLLVHIWSKLYFVGGIA